MWAASLFNTHNNLLIQFLSTEDSGLRYSENLSIYTLESSLREKKKVQNFILTFAKSCNCTIPRQSSCKLH